MGQKVHPKGFRLGVIKDWDSRWYAEKDYAKLLHEDIRIRGYIKERLFNAGVSNIIIERTAKRARINIHAARPGIIIGKKGAEVEGLRREIQKMTADQVVVGRDAGHDEQGGVLKFAKTKTRRAKRVLFKYTPAPATWQAWVEACFAIGFVACGLSQVIHGRRSLHRA